MAANASLSHWLVRLRRPRSTRAASSCRSPFLPLLAKRTVERFVGDAFADLLLDDPHMKNVGHWTTRFHDNEFIKYVDEEMVEMCNSPKWNPDWRGIHLAPYSKELIGMPEWIGAGNAGWNTPYRCINDCFIQGFALALVMMEDGRKLFAHEPYFDFADRCQSRIREETKHNSRAQAPAFVQNMWAAYRKDYPTTYDAAKWDSDAVIEWCTTPTFSLKAAPKAYGIFELEDDEPIRIAIGSDVDLSRAVAQIPEKHIQKKDSLY